MQQVVYYFFAGWIAVLTVINAYLLIRVVLRLRTDDGPLLNDDECPLAFVILSLRGGDPFLHRTLTRLNDQDYPNYRVRVMLDSFDDEAAAYVHDVLGPDPSPKFEICELTQRRSTCTYKMSAILEATQDLSPEIKVVALLDGDSVLHRSWLRELATPLVRGEADVVTGNRWYVPDRATLPNYVRFWWSAFALPLMYLLRFPWGGSMAVRPELIQQPQLRERIGTAFSEDTTIGNFAEEQGGRVLFQRRLVVNNGEDVSLRGFFNFDTRQMLAVKMQHPGWLWLGGHGLLNSGILMYCLLRGGWDFEPWIVSLFRVLLGIMLAIGFVQDWCIRQVLRERGETLPAWTPWRIVLALVSILVLPFFHVGAVIRAYVTQLINWRGVIYRLGGKPPVIVERDLWRERRPIPAPIPSVITASATESLPRAS